MRAPDRALGNDMKYHQLCVSRLPQSRHVLHSPGGERQMKRVTLLAVLGLALATVATTASPQWKLDRSVLPIAEPKPPTYTELDARKAKPPPRFEVKAPKGAPNVVIVLIDDVGFGG